MYVFSWTKYAMYLMRQKDQVSNREQNLEDAGEGVTDTDRWMAGIWIVGLARQNEEVAACTVGIRWGKELVLAKFPSVDACWFESARRAALWRARAAAFESILFLSHPCYMSESRLFISFRSFTGTNSIYQTRQDISWWTDIEAVVGMRNWLCELQGARTIGY